MSEEEKKKKSAEEMCKREGTKDLNSGKIDAIGPQDQDLDHPPIETESGADNANNPPPANALPAEFKKKILSRAQGRKVVDEEVLVIQTEVKDLKMSDINDSHNFWAIPVKEVRNKFLSEKEDIFVKTNSNVIEAGMIEREGKVESVNLSLWLKPFAGFCYIFDGEGWKTLRSLLSRLEAEDVVQLWAVHIEEDLCFVFIKLDFCDNNSLPAEFKNKILNRAQGRKIEEEVLVIEKKLTATDLSDHHNRFLIPVNQMRNRFLREKDDKFLELKGPGNLIETVMIAAEGEAEKVNLKRWVMEKESGNHNISYVLNGKGWKNIRSSNELKKGNVVQLWAVQIEEELCFAFVKLEK